MVFVECGMSRVGHFEQSLFNRYIVLRTPTSILIFFLLHGIRRAYSDATVAYAGDRLVERVGPAYHIGQSPITIRLALCGLRFCS